MQAGIDPSTARSFWAAVDRGGPDECWPHTGTRDYQGYVQLWIKGAHWGAHRLAWALANGPIPAKHHVHHRCENKACCNPSHLQCLAPGDHALVGATPPALNAKKDTCVNGHPLDSGNTYRIPGGGRACKSCRRAASARHRRTKKERV